MTATFDITAILPGGILRSRAIDDGLTAAWIANGYQPLSAAQVLAVTGPAPSYPTVLPATANPDDGLAAYGFDLLDAR